MRSVAASFHDTSAAAAEKKIKIFHPKILVIIFHVFNPFLYVTVTMRVDLTGQIPEGEF